MGSRNEFCTLFDLNYLPRGLVLYHSLAEVCDEFRLRVFCMDRETKQTLDALALPNLITIGLEELESHDRGLYEVKPTRTQLEYCWTATPAVCLYALEREPDIEQITYLDADLMFFSDPVPLFNELDGESILLVPHNYADEFKHWVETSGTYNVEFMTFRRSPQGLEALNWWRARCLEWCFYRFEDGKLGDQLYLNDWPERFEGVRVLEHPGGGVAPWNISRFELGSENRGLTVDGRPLVFYHYHSLRLHVGTALARVAARLSGAYRAEPEGFPFVWSTNFIVGRDEMALIWHPYLRRLALAYAEVQELEPTFVAGVRSVGLGEVLTQATRNTLPTAVRSAFSHWRRGFDRIRIPKLSSPRSDDA